MSLQDFFYLIASISMVLWIIIIVMAVVAIYEIKRSVRRAKESAPGRLLSFVKKNRSEALATAGVGLLTLVVNAFKGRSKKSSKS